MDTVHLIITIQVLILTYRWPLYNEALQPAHHKSNCNLWRKRRAYCTFNSTKLNKITLIIYLCPFLGLTQVTSSSQFLHVVEASVASWHKHSSTFHSCRNGRVATAPLARAQHHWKCKTSSLQSLRFLIIQLSKLTIFKLIDLDVRKNSKQQLKCAWVECRTFTWN